MSPPALDHTRSRLLEGPIGRTLLSLSVPIILGNLLQTGYQLTDAFWIGRLGAVAVAAVAVSLPVTFLVIALGSGLAMAGAVLIAQYAGAGQQHSVDHVAGQTMVMVLITSILLAAAGYLLTPNYLTLLDVANDVRADALGFMRMSFVGVVFVFVYAMFQALMRGIGHTRLPLFIVLGTVVLNFMLDPLFIFGWGPVPGAGVVGAALATVVTQGLAASVGIAVLLRGRHGIHLQWQRLRPDAAYLRHAFLLGLPGSIDLSTRAVGLIVMPFMLARFGTLPIAVYGVGATVLQVASIPAAGLSMALSTLVGLHLGAGKVARAKKIARLGIGCGFGGLSAVGVGAFLGAPALVALLIPSDAQAIVAGTHFIRIMALTWGGIGIQFCTVAVLRASGRMGQAMVIGLASQWLIQFPLAYVLSRHTQLQADGVWWSFPVSNLVAALLALGWFAHSNWTRGRFTAPAGHAWGTTG